MFKTKRLLSLLLAIVMIASLAITSMVSVSATGEGWNGTDTEAPAGKGTQAEPYLIASAENLAWLSAAVCDADFFGNADNKPADTTGWPSEYISRKVFQGTYFKQTADIDLNNQKFRPIGNYWDGQNSVNRNLFGGVYDGAGFKISNAKINAADWNDAITPLTGLSTNGSANVLGSQTHVSGLFGGTSAGALIENVNAVNIDVGSYTDGAPTENIAGVIVGYAIENTIKNCTTDATSSVTGIIAGGIVGLIAQSDNDVMTVSDCVNNATVTGDAAVGGIVGVINGDVSWCVNNGTIQAYPESNRWGGIGGIAGMPYDTAYKSTYKDICNISYCVNSANAQIIVNYVASTGVNRFAAGGIIGDIFMSAWGNGRDGLGVTISDCYNLMSEVRINGTMSTQIWVPCGGIAGFLRENSGNNDSGVYTFKNCYSVAGSDGYYDSSEAKTPTASCKFENLQYNTSTDTSGVCNAAFAGIFSGGNEIAKFKLGMKLTDANTADALLVEAFATCHYGVSAETIEADIIYRSIIEAADTETNDVTYVGVQDSLIKGSTYSVRFIAGLSSTAYKAAGFKVTINGVTKTYTSADAYTTLTGIANTGDTKTYDAADYEYEAFTALVIADIPTGSAITFEITPLVVKGDATYEGNTYTVEYDANGYFVSQCASQPQD